VKPLTAKQVADILIRNGFFLVRQKGSHAIYRNQKLGITVPIPSVGGNRELPIGTFLNIIKQSRLPKSEFEIR